MKNGLFLVSIIASIMLMKECGARSDYHEYGDTRRYEKSDLLEVNDRGLENNRDFSTMIQDGLIFGMFKVTNNRGRLDCVDEGLTIARAIVRLGYRIFVSKEYETEMDFYNLAEWIFALSEKCNYHSTIQGLVVNRILRDSILESMRGHKHWIKFSDYVIVGWESVVNMIDDSVVMAKAAIGLYTH